MVVPGGGAVSYERGTPALVSIKVCLSLAAADQPVLSGAGANRVCPTLPLEEIKCVQPLVVSPLAASTVARHGVNGVGRASLRADESQHRMDQGGMHPPFFCFFSLLHSSLELSDTKVYEP